jgi:hypothetical protein
VRVSILKESDEHDALGVGRGKASPWGSGEAEPSPWASARLLIPCAVSGVGKAPRVPCLDRCWAVRASSAGALATAAGLPDWARPCNLIGRGLITW